MNPRQSALVQLHLAVLIFGFTGILGRLISIEEGPLVWYRMMIASLSFLVIPRFWKTIKSVNRKNIPAMMGTGALVAAHWICFFGSIKYSNVSFALCMMATASLFTCILEPILLKRPFSKREFFLALLVIPGIIYIFQFSAFYPVGMILGIGAAFLAAFFGTLNKLFVRHTPAIQVTFIELLSGFLILSLFLPLYFKFKPTAVFGLPTLEDGLWLLLLGTVCTTLAFLLSVNVLKQLSAFTTSLSINLEPIYGILLAAILFNEQDELGSNFYVGAILILGAVLLNGLTSSEGFKKRWTKFITNPK